MLIKKLIHKIKRRFAMHHVEQRRLILEIRRMRHEIREFPLLAAASFARMRPATRKE